MLTRRLTALVDAGILDRPVYCERPPRDEYVLTERGRDFRTVLISLQTWGNRHFAPEGPSVILVDARTGTAADPILVDRVTGQPISDATHKNAAGPAAGAGVKQRLGVPRTISPSKASLTPATTGAKSTRRTSPAPLAAGATPRPRPW